MRLRHGPMGWLATALVVALISATSCTKRNPDICCDTADQCTHAGLDPTDGLAPCSDGVCVNYTCVASGCDDDLDCHDPAHPTCVSGQCYGAAELCRARGGAMVVFLSNRSGTPQIYSSFADGTGVVGIAQDEMPGRTVVSPSPDGTQLAYVQNGSIFAVAMTGGQTMPLTSNEVDIGVHWSPDGALLAIDPYPGDHAAYVMNADGTDRHDLVVSGGFLTRSPVWSSDSAQVAFLAQNTTLAESDLWIAQADGSGLKQLSMGFAPPPMPGSDPIWSPDGQSIILLSPDGDFLNMGNTMYREPVGGNNATVFSAEHLPVWEPTWSHDGQSLAVIISNFSNATSEDNSAGSVVATLPATGDGRIVSGVGSSAIHPRWSPNDQYILFQDKTVQGDLDVYRVNADGTGLIDLTMTVGDDFDAEWTPCPSAP